MKTDNSGMFDWALYGLLVRKHRSDAGFKKAELFSDAIWRRTRVSISRDTLYKIEQGKQSPSAEQFMAINLALFGSPFKGDIVQMCMSREWKEIIYQKVDRIPFEWKLENAQKLRDEFASVALDGEYPGLGIDETCHSESFKFYVRLVSEDEALFADERDRMPDVS